MIAIRKALQTDRQDILSFCQDTFSWGDYIDQAWGLWLQASDGMLLVAEADGKKVGLSHVAVCPGSPGIWIEGIRVHPSYRCAKVATALIDKMLEYGREKGAVSALAIVSGDNRPSQIMVEKLGFSAISEWCYYGTSGPAAARATGAKTASERDLGAIMDYLDRSLIYKQSAKKYVVSWRWYPLDRSAMANLVSEGRVVVAGSPVAGVAVLNRTGYWNKNNVLQIVYLDSAQAAVLQDILAYAANIFSEGKHERLQALFSRDRKIIAAVNEFNMSESEQFILYSKDLSG